MNTDCEKHGHDWTGEAWNDFCRRCGELRMDNTEDIAPPEIRSGEWVGGQALLERIASYLGNGGLFNPECMEHDKVRDLFLDCREYIERTQPPYRRRTKQA